MKVDFFGRSEEVTYLKEWIDNNMELKNRKDEYKWRRYYMMRYIYLRFGFCYARVGSFFDKDHTTVINALKQYEILDGYTDFQEAIHDLKVMFPLEIYENILCNSVEVTKALASMEINLLQKQVKEGLI